MMNFPRILGFLHFLLSFSLFSCCEIFLHFSAFQSFGWLACNNCKLQVVLFEDILPTDEVETAGLWRGCFQYGAALKKIFPLEGYKFTLKMGSEKLSKTSFFFVKEGNVKAK